MLAFKHRFHRRSAIAHIHKKGRQTRAGSLALRYVSTKPTQPSRVAVVVSKKVDKRAVVRNRIRRRIYEVFRKNWEHIESGQDMVVMVYDRGFEDMSAGELESSVVVLLKKAQVFKG